jgi:hypothetical protein
MATMNLLKSNINGKLGQTIGAKWKDKNIIKAATFGKAPPSPIQTDSVRAFECLNRLSSVYAKSFYKYFPVSSKTMLKHNAIAKYLGKMVSNHFFNPTKIVDIISSNPIIKIQSAEFVELYSELEVRVNYDTTKYIPDGTQIHLVVCDIEGYCGDPVVVPLTKNPIRISPPSPLVRSIYVIMFCSYPMRGKFFLFSSDTKEIDHMQYSLDEQPTGDFWLDGKAIYQITMQLPVHATADQWIYNYSIPGIEKMIKAEAYYYHQNGAIIPCNNPWPSQYGGIEIYVDHINVNQPFASSVWRITVTLFYTKI